MTVLPSRLRRVYHGLGGTPTYRSWYTMLSRCTNPEEISWRYYGARGISVCERWLSVENFVQDMGMRPPGMTLDRIDLDGNYEASNCRWQTVVWQNRHRRCSKLTMPLADEIRRSVADGAAQSELAARFGVDQSMISRVITRRCWA